MPGRKLWGQDSNSRLQRSNGALSAASSIPSRVPSTLGVRPHPLIRVPDPLYFGYIPSHAKTKDSPFFRSSGFPFLTEATTMSPEAAAGSLFSRAPIPWTAMTKRFLAPELSAQLEEEGWAGEEA